MLNNQLWLIFMKQILFSLILIFSFSFNEVNAQFSEDNAIYQTSEITIGNYLGLGVHANYVWKEKYSFKIGYSGFIRRPKSAPENYSPGFVGILTFGLANPYDQMQTFQILAGKIYPFNKKGTIRANISLGLGFTIIKEPTNWQPLEGNILYHNYSYEYHKYNTVSLIINPKIEFPFTRFYGLSISPMIQINKDRTYIGIGIGQMIGLLRKKNVKHTRLPADTR